MNRAFYCIQCLDKTTNKIGDFIHNDDFVAISPVFLGIRRFIYLDERKRLGLRPL